MLTVICVSLFYAFDIISVLSLVGLKQTGLLWSKIPDQGWLGGPHPPSVGDQEFRHMAIINVGAQLEVQLSVSMYCRLTKFERRCYVCFNIKELQCICFPHSLF